MSLVRNYSCPGTRDVRTILRPSERKKKKRCSDGDNTGRGRVGRPRRDPGGSRFGRAENP